MKFFVLVLEGEAREPEFDSQVCQRIPMKAASDIGGLRVRGGRHRALKAPKDGQYLDHARGWGSRGREP
jgi:hypothetical protein